MGKRILKSAIGQWIISLFIVTPIVLAAKLTCKVVIHGTAPDGKTPHIYPAWHGRLIFIPFFRQKGLPLHALISAHSDGKLIQKVAQIWGLNVVEGSTTQGGAQALRHLIKLSRRGNNLLITPDGPRGPRMHLSQGTMELARMTSLPVIPFGVSCSNPIIAKSWDKFMVPKPFSTIHIVWGSDVSLASKADEGERDVFKLSLESTLRDLQKQADTHAGIPPIQEATAS